MELLDIIRDIAIPVIIGILSLMTPILLEALSRIDNKYNSVILVTAFKRELLYKLYVFTLLASIVSIVLWCLDLPRIVNIPWLNNFIDNSAAYLLLTTTLSLVIVSLGVIWLLTIYYVPRSLLMRFTEKYNKSKENEFYFECISKLFNYSLIVPDDDMTRSSWDFVSREIEKHKDNKSDYPSFIYKAVYEADDLLCRRENNTIISFQNTSYFPPLMQYRNEISDKLYSFLWNSLRQFLFYDKTTYIYDYWKAAHYYYLSHFSRYSHNDNREGASNLMEQSLRFREFHYALCGLLLKQEKYDLLVKLFSFSHSSPATYLLVPESMNSLIRDYIYMSRDVTMDALYWERHYPYPEIDGVSASNAIQGHIMRVFGLLFLRQYTIPQYLTVIDPLDLPAVPEPIADKKYWVDHLMILKSHVKKLRDNNGVMTSLGYEALTNDGWFVELGILLPEELLDNYCSDIVSAEDIQEQSQTPEPAAIAQFKEQSAKIVNDAFMNCERFMLREKDSKSQYQSSSIRTSHYLLDKAAFCNNQGIEYINSLEITAQAVARSINYFSLNTFWMLKKQHFTLKIDDAFELIQQLNSSHKDLRFFAVGVNMEYLKINVEDLLDINGKWFYNGIEIVPIEGNQLLYQKFFIIKESDLPVLTHEEVHASVVSKYHLEVVDADRKIYASALDLNDPQYDEIKREVAKEEADINDLSKKVLACVDVNPCFNYKADAKVVMIDIYNEFTSKGSPQKLEDIKVVLN